MFDSWGTATLSQSGVYESQTKGFLSGGSIHARVKQESFRPLTITPPRLEVGCNGIDVYLGGLSYVKLDRFTKLLTQLGTSVIAGYAYQLAMEELCPQCASVLAKLEAAARKINAINLGGCQNAIQAQKNLTNITGAINDTVEAFQIATGTIDDKFDKRDDRNALTTTEAIAKTESDPQYKQTANLVRHTLRNAGATEDEIRLIISYVGDVIVDENGVTWYYAPLIDFPTLLDAMKTDTIDLWTCVDRARCLSMEEQQVTGISGFRVRTYQTMQTIVEKLVNKKDQMTTEEKNLIGRSPVAVLPVLKTAVPSKQRGLALVNHISDIVATQIALQWVQWAVNQAIQNAGSITSEQPNTIFNRDDLARFFEAANDRLQLALLAAGQRQRDLIAVLQASGVIIEMQTAQNINQ